jgi:conserved oligomeric Golgi complex subunit 6
LHNLRAESQATVEQLRAAHQVSIEDMTKEHANLLDSQVKALEKQIINQTLELKATQDDLAKAKVALEGSRVEIESLTAQRDEAVAAASAEAPPDAAIVEEVQRLTKELAHAKDDAAAAHDALDLTKQTLSEVSNNQIKELEEAAKSRAEEVMRLNTAHEEEIAALVEQKSDLATKLSDLEGELATLKASTSADPPASPKTNGTTQPASSGVTKEELQRMHEAHNAKVHDLQAEHEKALKALKENLDASISKSEELQEEVTRKAMEIQLLEQEQEDSSDQITRYVGYYATHDFHLGIPLFMTGSTC